LVLYNAHQGIDFIRRTIDDAQTVASIMLAVESPNQYATNNADGNDKW
jgi:hypothetical protein